MRYIDLLQITPGMKLAKAIFNEKGDILLQKDVVLTDKLIKRMKARELQGAYVEDALSEDINIEDLISPTTTQKGIKALKRMDIDEALEVAEQIADEISELKDISINLLGLRSKSNDTYLHSINVAVYSAVIGQGMGMKKGLLKELCASALLHDVGKLQVPKRILEKKEKLTEEEYELIKKHTEYGYELLKEQTLLTSKIRMGVYMHHENVDGTGYPLGITGKEIYLFAKIIHIADVYDALVSKRSYKEPELPGTSVQYLMNHAGTMFQPELVCIFINYVPLYPKGRTVLLNTGEQAIVVENRQNHTMYPVIRLFDGTTIDLYEENDEEYGIVGIL